MGQARDWAMSESLTRDYFEFVYGANADPWDYETSDYESKKFSATVAALPRERYRRGLEVGCSIGVLTERLAPKCEKLISIDLVPSVLERAEARCRRFPQVEFRQMAFPDDLPEGQFDLVVLSEVGYYLSATALALAQARLYEALEPGGQLLLVHWTPFVHDYPLTGDEVHDAFLADAQPGGALRHLANDRAATYRLDLFARN
jgi:SAM-dependent methyltransferase